MTRAPGKYKQKRGGGRSFSRNLTVNEDGIAVGTDKWGKSTSRKNDSSDEDEDEEEEGSEEESEEEVEEEDEGPSTSAEPEVELSRAERKALKKQKKQGPSVDEEDKDLINPNRLPVKQMAISDLTAAPRELSRREREAKEKAEAKERYWKLHQAGKTDEAKGDLARLAKIKEERAAAQAARKAVDEAKSTKDR